MKSNGPDTILIGTTNTGKVRELNDLLGTLPARLIGLEEAGIHFEVEETGATFAENAGLKAKEYARISGLFAIGDDSGLEVAALDGRPGVLSARYGGERTSFANKIELLLGELRASGDTDRSARFVCVMSLADPAANIVYEGEGICEGSLAAEPRGDGGFGYDPIFIPSDFNQTFGELDANIKQQISHRARAAAKIIQYLQGFLAV